MAYCALADLQERFGADEIARISDRAVPRKGSADAAVVAAAIAQADAEIDGYLGVVVTLPLASTPASTPELVKLLSCAIARYRLHEDQATDRIREDYDDAVRMLRDISAGRLVLSVAGVEVATTTMVVKAPSIVFTDSLLSLT